MLVGEDSLLDNSLSKKEDEAAENTSEAGVSKEMENLLKELPVKKQEAFKSVFARIYYQNNWKSEFPSPSVMKAYNDAFENGAYKIFLEIQKIADHKIAMDKLAIPIKLKQRRFGQIYGFVIAPCFMIASFILILLGFGIYGTILGSVNLISLVTIFVLDKGQNEYPQKT